MCLVTNPTNYLNKFAQQKIFYDTYTPANPLSKFMIVNGYGHLTETYLFGAQLGNNFRVMRHAVLRYDNALGSTA